MDKLRIIVADDSQFMRVAYKRILETQEHLEVVAMASDGEEAVAVALQHRPEVAVLDVRMPKINGIEAAHRIISQYPEMGIVVISAYDDTEYVAQLMQGEPRGKAYLLKTSIDDIDEFIRAVESVAEGQSMLDPTIVERLTRAQVSQASSPVSNLNDVERAVFIHMVEGFDDQDVADMVGLPIEFVETTINSVFSKFGLSEDDRNANRVRAVQTLVLQARGY